MKELKSQSFSDMDLSPLSEVRDKKFIKCTFDGCTLSFPFNVIPYERTRVINCVFENCEFFGRSSFQKKGYLENILLHNLKNSDYLRISGMIFNQVTFKGKFDKWMLGSGHRSMMVDYEAISEEDCHALDIYAQNEYKKIEWALDISEAEFKECDIAATIPAHLIKRNSETQVLIKYERLVKSKWEKNPKVRGSKAENFCLWVKKAEKDCVFVASVRDKKEFPVEMEAIKILRGEGIAELD